MAKIFRESRSSDGPAAGNILGGARRGANTRLRSAVLFITRKPMNAFHPHPQDHAIREDERDMAKINGGHIAKGEQKALNQQENAVGRQIER